MTKIESNNKPVSSVIQAHIHWWADNEAYDAEEHYWNIVREVAREVYRGQRAIEIRVDQYGFAYLNGCDIPMSSRPASRVLDCLHRMGLVPLDVQRYYPKPHWHEFWKVKQWLRWHGRPNHIFDISHLTLQKD